MHIYMHVYKFICICIHLSSYLSMCQCLCVCVCISLSLSLYISCGIYAYIDLSICLPCVYQCEIDSNFGSFPPEPWRTRDYPVDLVHLAIAPLLRSLSVLTHTWKLAVALWCMQTRQCCIDCRACKHTHWVSLYLCIINNNFPANMKVIRALCWIHWACSEYPVTSRYSAKSYRFCNSSSPKLPSQCNDWRIDDTTLTPITRPCCISHSGTLFCLTNVVFLLSLTSVWQVFVLLWQMVDKCWFCFDKCLLSTWLRLLLLKIVGTRPRLSCHIYS